jgi:hypothetical protein
MGQLLLKDEPVTFAKPFVVPKRLIWDAYQRVKANRGAAGVDGQSISDFDRNLSRNLYQIWNRMSSGCYFPPAVKAVPGPLQNLVAILCGPNHLIPVVKCAKACYRIAHKGSPGI